MIARGIEAEGRDALRLGSREPGAAVAARAQTEKQRRLSSGNLDLLPNFCQRVIDSNLKHWETFLQFFSTCPGAVPRRKFAPPSAILAALRKRNGQTVVGEGAPAKWALIAR